MKFDTSDQLNAEPDHRMQEGADVCDAGKDVSSDTRLFSGVDYRTPQLGRAVSRGGGW